MKSSFLKRSKRQSKNRVCNANAKFGDDILEKRSSWIITYICIYTYVKALNKKTPKAIYKLVIDIWNPVFFGMAFNEF